MPGGLGWRHCLVAFLLSIGQADFSNDLNDGDPEGSRSGNVSNIDTDSNETTADNAENFDESIEENKLGDTQATRDKSINDGLLVTVMEQENMGPEPAPLLPVYPYEQNFVDNNEVKSEHVVSDPEEKSEQYPQDQPQNPGGPVLRGRIVFPKEPTYEHDVLYPVDEAETLESMQSEKRLFSKLIPLENHILLHKIPGAKNAIQCSKEGEMHNFWAPSFQCMVCVCLSAYGRLRPVCVSCSTCQGPPGPEPGPTPPYTTPGPPRPPAPVPDQVSCKPLPADVPFQSPLDPCKICVCTETIDEWGQLDVQIHCQHNPQCVLPPYSTPRPPTPTPIPPPVCNEFPQNVPFPHPDDPCKLCKCTVRVSPYGVPEQQIDCYINPECQPTLEPETETPEPQTETPGPLPEPEICDRYPDNVIFPHPRDNCQVCKCTVHTSLLYDKKQITCYMRPNCIPTTLEPITEKPIEPEPGCEGYPENLMFPHPTDACKICKCVAETQFFNRDKKLICYLRPHCKATPRPQPTSTPSPWITSTQSPPPPQPDSARCAPLPANSPFQNPLNPCQICVCTERVDSYGRYDVNIECQENPQCVLPDNVTVLPPDIVTLVPLPTPKPTPEPPVPFTTQEPEPSYLCDRYPLDVIFPHPSDACRACQCYKNMYQTKKQITCFLRPECSGTPKPPSTTPEPDPVPDNDHICDRQLENVVFPDPHDQCRLCRCYRDPGSFFQKRLICTLKPECSSSPRPKPGPVSTPAPTPSPETVSCAPFPAGAPFQNPLHPCQVCICTERADQFGRHDVTIECQENQQCVLPPDTSTLPPVVSTPIPLPACKEFPENVLFPHPQDACQVCKCTVERKLPYGQPEEVISCVVRPECLPTTASPGPFYTTPSPDPILEVCAMYPDDTSFDDPNDPCRVCVCMSSYPGATPSINSQRVQIQCVIKPECLPTQQPPTEEPGPFDLCDLQSINVPFTHPTDPCQLCICFLKSEVPAPAGHSLAPPPGALKAYHSCTMKPECFPPSPEPMVTTTLAPAPGPTATPNVVSCKPLPSGTPFQNPLNPCQVCVCKEAIDVFGRPDVIIKCQENPRCVIAPDVTTIPPTPNTPVPLPACANFPSNVVFPHPQDACQLCKCSVAPTAWGVPEQQISCFSNPDCEPTPNPVTITPPEPSLCERYPSNVLFPLPQDKCRLCRCTVERNPYGGTKQQINCFTNPSCSPSPPAPPGPLPGPAPHESCIPYTPNKPFQHPWDECQVCVCTEAITIERITIEVNCFTKPSCCIELPIDIPKLPGQSGFPAISGSPGSGSVVIGTGSVKAEESIKDFLTSKFPGSTKIIESGGHLLDIKRDDVIGSSIINVIEPVDGKLNGPASGNLIRPNLIGSTGENWAGSSGGYVDRPSGGNIFRPRSGSKFIGSTDENVIGSSDGNLFIPDDEKANRPIHNSWSGSTGGNIIDSLGEKWVSYPMTGNEILSSSEKNSGSTSAKGIGLSSGSNWIGSNTFESAGGNLISSSGNLIPPNVSVKKYNIRPNLIGSNIPNTISGGNVYLPNSGNMMHNKRPIGNTVGSSHWRIHPMFTKPGQVIGKQNQQPKILPVHVGYQQLSSENPEYRHISVDKEFRVEESSGYYVDTKAEQEMSVHGQGANAHAEVTASVSHPRISTRMRTKSGRPQDYDQSQDYD